MKNDDGYTDINLVLSVAFCIPFVICCSQMLRPSTVVANQEQRKSGGLETLHFRAMPYIGLPNPQNID
jgi:hypothetical protein